MRNAQNGVRALLVFFRRRTTKFQLTTGLFTTVLALSALVWILWPKGPPSFEEWPEKADLTTGVPVGERRGPDFTTKPTVQTPTPPPATKAVSAPVPSDPREREREEEVKGAATLFDPASPETPERYRLPVELTTEDARKLMRKVDLLFPYVELYNRRVKEYNDTYELIANHAIKEVLYDRIKTNRGFKYAELPQRWTEFSEQGQILPDARILQVLLVVERVDAIKGNIIAGRVTRGDLAFCDWIIRSYFGWAKGLSGSLTQARKIKRWFIDEGILDEDGRIAVQVVNEPQQVFMDDDDAKRFFLGEKQYEAVKRAEASPAGKGNPTPGPQGATTASTQPSWSWRWLTPWVPAKNAGTDGAK